MSNSFEVRVAGADDAVGLGALLAELEYPTPVDIIIQRLAALERSGELVLVAARDGDILGFVTVHVTPVLHRPTPVGRITALAVATRAHRQGVGKALVEASERHLVDAGCGLIEITSNRRRTGAHAFYEKQGYAITSYRFRKDFPRA